MLEVGEFVGGAFLIMLLLGIAALALIIYALVDLFKRPMDNTLKIIWALAILFFPIIGSVVYLIIGRSMRGTAF